MNFCLRALGQNKGVEITQQEFVELKNAKQTIVQYLRIEDTFDVMMENYVELERTLFHVAMDHLAFSLVVSDELHLKRSLISRRLMNLFASTQLYRNTLKRQSSKILKRGNGAEAIKAAVDDSSDQPMEFRLMQVIRNYSQHDELPLSSLSVGGRKTGADKESEQFRFAYSVTPKIDGPAIAAQRRSLPADIESALIELGSKADVMPLVRKSLERWGEIHKAFRAEIEPLATSAETIIRGALARVQATQEKRVALIFLMRDEDDEIDSIQLFDDLFTQVDYLKKKNRSQVNISRRHVEWT